MTQLTDKDRKAKQQELIESLGTHVAGNGGQHINGRIVGLLLFSDKEEFTFDEIVSELKVRKSSVSVAINNLLMTGRIEYFTIPGDRKKYFRTKALTSDTTITDILVQIDAIYRLHQKALTLKPDTNSRSATLLKNMLKGIDIFRQALDSCRMKTLYGDFDISNHDN